MVLQTVLLRVLNPRILPFTKDLVNSLLAVIIAKPTGEFITAFMHRTHSIWSRASMKRFCLSPDDKDERPSNKQLIPPRFRNSFSHSLFAFSRRARSPEKFLSDGVSKSLTHSSGSASEISTFLTDEPSLPSPESFRHFDFELRAILIPRQTVHKQENPQKTV